MQWKVDKDGGGKGFECVSVSSFGHAIEVVAVVVDNVATENKIIMKSGFSRHCVDLSGDRKMHA